MARKPPPALVRSIRDWALDPLSFVREALRAEPTRQQTEAIEAIRSLVWAKIRVFEGTGDDRDRQLALKVGVSIQSGMGTGKDALASWMLLWWLCCFPRPIVLATAGTHAQLRSVLWREVYKWLSGRQDCKALIEDWITWQAEKIFLTERGGRDWYAIPRTANPKDDPELQAETMAGIHEDYVLYIVDEATAVPEPVFKPFLGALTGKCNWVLMLFNPTRPNSFAVRSQKEDRARWVCLHWDAEESELVSKESIETKARMFGRDSNFFRVTVKGELPTSTSDSLIPWEWAADAIERPLEARPEDPVVFGLDIGAGGDPSVICIRRGPVVQSFEVNNTADSEQLTFWVLAKTTEYQPAYILADVLGVGWAVVGNLRARLRGSSSRVVGVNIAETPAENTRFYRTREELAWRVRELFESRIISIPDDTMLIGELSSIRYSDESGKIKLESKLDTRRRIGRSPNKFDALALTEYAYSRHLLGFERESRAFKRDEPLSWKVI